jgi:hypothetical protein
MSAPESMIFDPTLSRKYIIFCSEAKTQSLPGVRWGQRQQANQSSGQGPKAIREAERNFRNAGWRNL